MQDSQESNLPPSSPPPLPTPASEYDNELYEVSSEVTITLDPAEAMLRVRAFGEVLLAAACPACQAGAPTIQGAEVGAKCVNCGWGIEMRALEQLGNAFGSHA